MDEEFYKFIEKKREEVDELDIDGEEKERLYNLIEETIERYELGKVNYQKGIKASVEFGIALGKLKKNSKELDSIAKDTNVIVKGLQKKSFWFSDGNNLKSWKR